MPCNVVAQAVAFMLADMAVGIEAGRMLTYKAATEIDAGRNNTMYASMAKVYQGSVVGRPFLL